MRPLLTTDQTAQLTTLSASTLRKMRMLKDGGGLPFVKLGRRCAYRTEDVEAFVMARRASSTWLVVDPIKEHSP